MKINKKQSLSIFMAGFLLHLYGSALATPYELLENAYSTPYGKWYCFMQGFQCYKVRRTDTWTKLFPNPTHRDIVQRLNRTNVELNAFRNWIVVPEHLETTSLLEIAPFPKTIQLENPGRNYIVVDLAKHAFGAYDEQGFLQHWGAVSAGQKYCPDIYSSCTSEKGKHIAYRKEGEDYVSTIFPRRKNGQHGGAEMPYPVFYYQGFAIHASTYVPGYHASHGCLRVTLEDAKWINENFVKLKSTVIEVIGESDDYAYDANYPRATYE